MKLQHAWKPTLILIFVLAIPACSTFEKTGQALIPSENVIRTGSFALYTGRSIAPNSPAVHSLNALETEVGERLGVRGTPGDPPVEIYVLKDRNAFTHLLTIYYPELPNRRAFFLAQGEKRVIYTYENDKLQEDLRHEATHALLHKGVGDLPLWVDEGLAEYFEGPGDRRGLNPEHLARLPTDLEKGWKPDLPRLEQVKSVKDMTPRDYRESWAWMHFLLDPANPSGGTILIDYLADVRASKSDAEPLSARLAKVDPNEGAQMLSHLEKVRHSKTDVSAERASLPSKVRLQNSAIGPEKKLEIRPGFFGRVADFFGFKPRP